MFPGADKEGGPRMHVVPVADPADPRLRDYVGLTDVVLRRLSGARRRPVPGRVGEGHRARPRRRSPAALGAAAAEVARRARRRCSSRFDVPVYLADPDVLEKITGFVMHRGALASMHRPPLPAVAEVLRDARRVVVLEDIVDHTNVGAIFRAVAGLGADAVLITPRCADPYLPAGGAGQHGHRAADPVDAARRVAAAAPSSCTRPGSRSRRSPSTTVPSTSRRSRSIRPTGSRCCSEPRATD